MLTVMSNVIVAEEEKVAELLFGRQLKVVAIVVQWNGQYSKGV